MPLKITASISTLRLSSSGIDALFIFRGKYRDVRLLIKLLYHVDMHIFQRLLLLGRI